MTTAAPASRRFLERLGLHRPELRAWAMYDWANSAFMTTIVAAVFPIYFQQEAAAGLEPAVALARYGYATTLAGIFIAAATPFLGAIADYTAVKKRMLAAFIALGAGATAAMWLIQRGDWMLAIVLLILANAGAFGSFTFYNALLPSIARPDEIDRVSTAGYAIGYLGGGLLLAVNLAWITSPATFGLADAGAASRLSFVSVGIWWALFSIPILRGVPEPAVALAATWQTTGELARMAYRGLIQTLKELRGYRQAAVMLLAFAIYNDGINTIIRMATSYGAQIGIEAGDLVLAILLVQFVGVPFSFLFGSFAGWIGPKRAIFAGLTVYAFICVLAYFMRTAVHFYALALLVGMVQGGTQALSRSLFATLIPRAKTTQFFAFYGIFEKFSGLVGPAILATTVSVTGSPRLAVLSVIVFFVVGALLLSLVDVQQGRKTAGEADRRLSRP